jgi:hypothetical protein
MRDQALPSRSARTLMKNLFLPLALALGLSPIANAQQAWLPGDILVMVKPGASATAIANDLSTLNGQPTQLRVVEELSAPMRVWHLHYDNAALREPEVLRAVQARGAERHRLRRPVAPPEHRQRSGLGPHHRRSHRLG